MIYMTGDTHGDFTRFSSSKFPEGKSLTKDDYVIICGDFGGVWDGSNREKYWLDWLEDKPFTTLFVDGNHENFDMLYSFPEKMWNGGKVHVIKNSILHLMRGQVFDLCGKSWFTMGGAASHDVWDGILDPEDPFFEEDYWRLRRNHGMFRVKGLDWWEEELPTQDEYEEAIKNLSSVNWKIDSVVSHCAPSNIVKKIDNSYKTDVLTDFLSFVRHNTSVANWYFGHYHRDLLLDSNTQILYTTIIAV